MLQSVTECYRVLQSVTECYRVLQSITGYYKVLQSITKTFLVERHATNVVAFPYKYSGSDYTRDATYMLFEEDFLGSCP